MASKNANKERTSASVMYDPKPYTGILAEPPPDYMLVARPGELQTTHIERCLAALAKHYGLPPDDGYNGWRLAMSLARDHVPALQGGHQMARARARRATSKGQPTRLGPVDTCRFIYDAGQIIEREEKAGRKRPSNLKLGRELAKREWAKRCKLKAETIRKLLRDVWDSTAATAEGRATEFQAQFIMDVVPMLRRLMSDDE
jgi:hypothetical protein